MVAYGLTQLLRADLKQAMKDKDTNKKNVIRALLAECDEFEKVNKRPMEQQEEDAIVLRTIKQTQESLEAFEKGGRTELVEEVKAQLVILRRYEPEQFTEEQVREIIQKNVERLQLEDANQGELMKNLMPIFKSQTNKAMIKRVIGEFAKK